MIVEYVDFFGNQIEVTYEVIRDSEDFIDTVSVLSCVSTGECLTHSEYETFKKVFRVSKLRELTRIEEDIDE